MKINIWGDASKVDINGLIDRINERISDGPEPRRTATILERLCTWIRQRACRHRFDLNQLHQTGIAEPVRPEGYDADWDNYWHEYYYGDWQNKRVVWPCAKCGKVFHSSCGHKYMRWI